MINATRAAETAELLFIEQAVAAAAAAETTTPETRAAKKVAKIAATKTKHQQPKW